MRQFTIGLLASISSLVGSFATPVVDWVATNGDSTFINGSETTSSPVSEDADADTLVGSFPAVTLAVDESIVLTGTFNITGRDGNIPGNQIRWALFDAPGTPATGMGSGYIGVWATIAGGAVVSNIRSADGSTGNPFSGGATTILADATGTGGLAQFGTDYSFSLTITRIDDSQMSVTAMITDEADFLIEWPVTIAPASPVSFTYDSVGILVGGTTNAATATFTDIEIEVLTDEPVEVVISEIEYNQAEGLIALTFSSRPNKEYTITASNDLNFWTVEIDDAVIASTDSNETRYEFEDTDLGARLFLRVTENP